MKEYRFKDLVIGQAESFEYIVTEEKMKMFQGLTGDNNPLHTDSEYAFQHGFSNRVVYGMLSASLMSTLGGVYLPGRFCLIQQVECKFASPLYVGDVLTVKGTVKELNESVQQAVIKVEIRNQKSEKVVRGLLSVGFLE